MSREGGNRRIKAIVVPLFRKQDSQKQEHLWQAVRIPRAMSNSLGILSPFNYLLTATCGFPSSSPQAATGIDYRLWVSDLKDLYFAPRRTVLLGQHINNTNYSSSASSIGLQRSVRLCFPASSWSLRSILLARLGASFSWGSLHDPTWQAPGGAVLLAWDSVYYSELH